MEGGRGPVMGDGSGRSSGEVGAVVSENGEGVVGGGRWINVRSSSSKGVTAALGLLTSGSGAW